MSDRPPASTSRRRFLGALGATAALPLVTALPAWSQPPEAPSPPKTDPEPQESPERAGDTADAKNLLEILQRRFANRFDAAQLEAMRDDLEGSLRAGRALRDWPLRNSDEPDVIFRALTGEK
jgi:Spy/CpxP family protein refolding chaperone